VKRVVEAAERRDDRDDPRHEQSLRAQEASDGKPGGSRSPRDERGDAEDHCRRDHGVGNECENRKKSVATRTFGTSAQRELARENHLVGLAEAHAHDHPPIAGYGMS
jgi:hypothetical protein